MNWNNMWNILFNRTELFGINMGFWVCLLFITIIVILMNVVFWSMKPLKTVEEQKNIKYYKLKKDLWYITAGLFELSSKNKKLKIVMITIKYLKFEFIIHYNLQYRGFIQIQVLLTRYEKNDPRQD